jgi:hypothetical protein
MKTVQFLVLVTSLALVKHEIDAGSAIYSPSSDFEPSSTVSAESSSNDESWSSIEESWTYSSEPSSSSIDQTFVDSSTYPEETYSSSSDTYTTEMIPTTTTTAEPYGCLFTEDLFEPNGRYISSTCHFRQGGRTSATAVTSCRSLGMTLFTITSAQERNALIRLANRRFGIGASFMAHISGQFVSGRWVDSNDGTTWLGGFAYPSDTTFQGSCIGLGSLNDPSFKIMQINCIWNLDTICKFTNESLVSG